MTAKLDSLVQAAPPSLVPLAKPGPAPVVSSTVRPDPAAREREHADHVARWKAIGEAGGIDKWVASQLSAKGLANDHVDPSTLSDAERANYKNRKRAEAEERRTLHRAAWQAYRATHIVHLGAGIHWDDDASPDKFDSEHREERARALDLPPLASVDDLATALALPVARLRWLTFHRDVDTGSHYRRWSIAKRDGSARTITAPKKSLKSAQRWALRHVAEKLPVHGAAHGFLPARSIVTNAQVHAGADVIVKLDLSDFFPTVTFRRVKGLLRKAGFPEQIATLLALLSTESPRELVQFRGKTHYVATGARALPQGAPTSPAYSNAVCMRMDRRLSGLARAFGFRYTRYADDLTFSWRAPAKRAAGTHPRAPVGALLRGARVIVRAEGFRVHPRKTRVLRAGDRQRVTGLVVNRAKEGVASARVPRDVVRTLRAAIHNREQGKPGREGESLTQLNGMAAFVYMTDPARGRAFLDRIAALASKGKD